MNAKVKSLRQQLDQPRIPGALMVIRCPYCNKDTVEGTTFCCNKIRSALFEIMRQPKQNHA